MKKQKFNPDRNYISKKVKEFLAKGGKIRKIKPVDRLYHESPFNSIIYSSPVIFEWD